MNEILKIDKSMENEFNYEILENLANEHKIVFIYVYNDLIEEQIGEMIDKNIEMVIDTYNPNLTIKINASAIIHQKFIDKFDTEISLPLIIVYEDKEIVEFLKDIVLLIPKN